MSNDLPEETDEDEDLGVDPYAPCRVTFVPPEGGNGVGYAYSMAGATSIVFKDGKPDLKASITHWKKEETDFLARCREAGRKAAEKIDDEVFKILLGTTDPIMEHLRKHLEKGIDKNP